MIAVTHFAARTERETVVVELGDREVTLTIEEADAFGLALRSAVVGAKGIRAGRIRATQPPPARLPYIDPD